MATWHKMDMQYLDPGLLTNEEHHLLLLHSRAYFEKWKAIHTNPRDYMPQKRIKRGTTVLLKRVSDVAGLSSTQFQSLADALVDDCALIAMKPRLWTTAHLDPKLREQFTGTVLNKAAMTPSQQKTFFECLDSLRAYRVQTANGTERVIQFSETPTLWDLYLHLGLGEGMYNGQLRVLDFQERGKVISLRNEDDFFDFLYYGFVDGEFPNGSPYPGQACTKYEIQILPESYTKARTGVWF